jgi:hypothetical protein
MLPTGRYVTGTAGHAPVESESAQGCRGVRALGTGKFAARRDLALIAVIAAAAAAVCIRWDLSEALLGWTRQHESLQLDELPAVLLVLATCLIWFSSRRYFEARRELVLRRASK